MDRYSSFHGFMCVSLYIYVDATIVYWKKRIMSSAVCWLFYYFLFCFWDLSLLTSVLLFSLQIIPMWWFNWVIYLCLLSVLLLRTLRHVWIHADLIFFRIHGLHMLWFLLDAGNDRIPCCIALCPPHLSINQVWVGILCSRVH